MPAEKLKRTALSVTLLLTSGCLAPTHAYIIKTSRWKYGDFTFAKTNFNWNNDFQAKMDISRAGRKLIHRQDHDVWVWTKKLPGPDDTVDDDEPRPLKPRLTEAEASDKLHLVDLNNDGIKDVVIRQWNGGAYCCYKYEIFSLEKSCPRLWYHDAGCGHLKIIERPGKSAILAMEDGTYVGWGTFNASSYRPVVHLTWTKAQKDRAPHIDWRLQRRPVNKARFDSMQAKQIDDEKQAYFIELVYTGQKPAAMRLLEHNTQAERAEFLQSFNTQFRKSPFYRELQTK